MNGNQFVDHILRFENIKDEFEELMIEYDYSFSDLSRKDNAKGPANWVPIEKRKFTFTDFTKETIAFHSKFIITCMCDFSMG